MKAYLEKLIKVLNEDDIAKIKAIALKTSKLKVFLNYLVQIRTGEEMEKEELMKYLRVDDKMMRKMKSVLLRKCYDALTPNDGIELLDILSRYRLVENFKRELVLQESKIKSKSDKEAKRKFYEAAVTNSMRLPFSAIDVVELDKYAQLNLKYSKDHEKELQALFHSGRILVIRMIHEYYQRDKKHPNKNSYINTIEKLEIGAEKHRDDSLKAMSVFCRALLAYCIELNFEEAKRLFSLLKSDMKSIESLPEDISLSINGFFGTTLYHLNEFDSAIQTFEEYIKIKSPFFFNQPHLLSRLSELYMIKGRMVEAKEILDKHLKRFLESGEEDAIQITSITYTKYYLLNDELPKAFEHLQVARQHLNKKFYLLNDIDIRTLELIYFILSGDLKFSKAILQRTLKFLREKVKTKELRRQIEKQELLNKLCKAKDRKRSMKNFINPIKETFRGFSSIISILLQKYCLVN